MKSYVVLDTAFMVATVDGNDTFHTDAAYLFKELINRKDHLQILVPPLVLYELIVTLRRKGLQAQNLEKILMRFVNLDYVSIISLSEMSAFKHAAHALNSRNQQQALRTHDFLIFCVANEFDGLLVTFDRKMIHKCRTVYAHAYYPSAIGEHSDDSIALLQAIDKNAGKDTTKIAYLPF